MVRSSGNSYRIDAWTRTCTRTQFAAELRRLADSIEPSDGFSIQVAGERLRIPADLIGAIA